MVQRERTTLRTPEGVSFELPLAGLGSRFLAVLIDLVLQFTVLGVMSAAGSGAFQEGGLLSALGAIGGFVMLFGYPFLCEGFLRGRTLGKRIAGLRVVDAQGGPASVTQSAVRNLLRLVDFLPFSYIVGVASILGSVRGQRLGDLAAGTLVVVEPKKRRGADSTPFLLTPKVASRTSSVQRFSDQALLWDVVAVSAKDMGIVQQFLLRRNDLEAPVRLRIATEFATKLRPLVIGADECLDPEVFLESVVAAKQFRG